MSGTLTNEQLVVRIQQGDDGLYPYLWEAVRRFVAMKARWYACRVGREFLQQHGCELDDLISAGYIATVEAAQKYNRFRGANFLTYLSFFLLREFRSALGIRSSKIHTLNCCESLDDPQDMEDGSISKYDALKDLNALDPEIATLESVYNQELRAALDTALEILPEDSKKMLVLYYYFGISMDEIAELSGTTKQNVSSRIDHGLWRIYHSSYRKALSGFLWDGYFDPFYGTGGGNKALLPTSESVQERYLMSNRTLEEA